MTDDCAWAKEKRVGSLAAPGLRNAPDNDTDLAAGGKTTHSAKTFPGVFTLFAGLSRVMLVTVAVCNTVIAALYSLLIRIGAVCGGSAYSGGRPPPGRCRPAGAAGPSGGGAVPDVQQYYRVTAAGPWDHIDVQPMMAMSRHTQGSAGCELLSSRCPTTRAHPMGRMRSVTGSAGCTLAQKMILSCSALTCSCGEMRWARC